MQHSCVYSLNRITLKSFFSIHLDSLGFFTSLLCAVHCILTPLLIIILPLIGNSFLTSEAFESLIIGMSILLVFSSLIKSYIQNHKKRFPLILAFLGAILLASTYLVDTHFLEVSLSMIGGSCIAFSHLKNWKLCRIYYPVNKSNGHVQ